jgi:ABC-2 type transport system permease protein
MRKIWTIAVREYKAMVATKAFLLSVTLMPILMLGGIVVASRFANVRDVRDKILVVADGTDGVLFADLAAAAEAFNAALAAPADESGTDSASVGNDQQSAPKVILERSPSIELSDADRIALSDRIRQGSIEAFVEIPAGVLQATDRDPRIHIGFYAQNAMLSPERQWLESVINDSIRERRLAEFDIDPAIVRQASVPVNVAPLGLYKQRADGTIQGADESRNIVSLFAPFGIMMLMFMVIFLAAQPMLESLLEEKSERIAEVLLGAASPFQLMSGKLLGNVAGSLTVVAIYGVGGYLVAARNGWTDVIPMRVIPWFLAFQVLAVLLYSSLFMAVGASVRQLKDAQSLLLPVWLLMVCPMFVWLQIVREPNGTIATWLTFFPPATPLVMLMRLTSEAVIPLWQTLAGMGLLAVCTLAGVYLTSRIFRIGILWQGKSPRIGELCRWALRG